MLVGTARFFFRVKPAQIFPAKHSHELVSGPVNSPVSGRVIPLGAGIHEVLRMREKPQIFNAIVARIPIDMVDPHSVRYWTVVPNPYQTMEVIAFAENSDYGIAVRSLRPRATSNDYFLCRLVSPNQRPIFIAEETPHNIWCHHTPPGLTNMQ